MSTNPTFSKRHAYIVSEAEIVVRHDAPEWLRKLIIRAAYEADLRPSDLRDLLCDILMETPDSNNWSEFPNVDNEVHALLQQAEWFQVYDLVEMAASVLQKRSGCCHLTSDAPLSLFAQKLNEIFRRKGVGWQLIEGQLQIRGPESFEETVREATALLESTGREVARHEMHQALADLSRRPAPDVTGAVQHAMAALECVARDVTGDPKSTLGDLLKKHPGLLPPPLDNALSKIWGFASDKGRHLRENDAPAIEEAELMVGLAGSLSTYMVKKIPKVGHP